MSGRRPRLSTIEEEGEDNNDIYRPNRFSYPPNKTFQNFRSTSRRSYPKLNRTKQSSRCNTVDNDDTNRIVDRTSKSLPIDEKDDIFSERMKKSNFCESLISSNGYMATKKPSFSRTTNSSPFCASGDLRQKNTNPGAERPSKHLQIKVGNEKISMKSKKSNHGESSISSYVSLANKKPPFNRTTNSSPFGASVFPQKNFEKYSSGLSITDSNSYGSDFVFPGKAKFDCWKLSSPIHKKLKPSNSFEKSVDYSIRQEYSSTQRSVFSGEPQFLNTINMYPFKSSGFSSPEKKEISISGICNTNSTSGSNNIFTSPTGFDGLFSWKSPESSPQMTRNAEYLPFYRSQTSLLFHDNELFNSYNSPQFDATDVSIVKNINNILDETHITDSTPFDSTPFGYSINDRRSIISEAADGKLLFNSPIYLKPSKTCSRSPSTKYISIPEESSSSHFSYFSDDLVMSPQKKKIDKKLCMYFVQGYCRRGSRCSFSHGSH